LPSRIYRKAGVEVCSIVLFSRTAALCQEVVDVISPTVDGVVLLADEFFILEAEVLSGEAIEELVCVFACRAVSAAQLVDENR